METLDAGTRGETADRVVEAWYAVEAPALQRYVRSLVRDPDEAEDICQETFLRLILVARAGRMPDAPAAWVRRVAHNLVVSAARRRTVSERALERLADTDVIPAVEEDIVRRERDRTLVGALEGAAEDDRTAMLLAAQGFRSQEIGDRLGRTELATRALLCRARGRLRERLIAADPAWGLRG